MPGVKAAVSLGEAEGIFADVLPEAAGGCADADESAPVLLQADSYTAVDNMREFWGRTLRFLRDFCIIILISGALRELLRHNTLLGLPVAMSFRTEAAEQPFFGLILSGFLLAVLRAVEAALRRAIARRRQAETLGKGAEA